MEMPSAIIFINNDMNDASQNTLSTQLELNEIITFDEFNARIAVDPNYPTIVHANKLRILVKLPSFRDITNRDLADIVLFLKQGMVSVEKNNFGPPGLTLPILRLNIWNLINGIKGATANCPPFPPRIEYPETQTAENPKPPEELHPTFPHGMGALELYGVEALEEANNGTESAFGGKIK